VLVTTFASNAARLQTLGEVARDTGRQLCVAGVRSTASCASPRASAISRISRRYIDFDAAMRCRANKVMIIATGGQGEARAALARIAATATRSS
jgi:ribonuclease J